MEAFLSGMLFGYGASVPIGPVNVLIMAHALRGFRYGVAVGLGAMSVDVIYLLLASLGVLALLNNAVFMTILGTFGAAFLLYIAWLTWKGADKLAGQVKSSNLNNAENDSNLKTAEETALACYLKGFFLNLVNPYIIGFWLSVASFAVQTGDVKASVTGLAVAIFSWIFGLSWAVAKSRRFIGGAAARWFAWISAALMAFFALYIAYNTFFGGLV